MESLKRTKVSNNFRGKDVDKSDKNLLSFSNDFSFYEPLLEANVKNCEVYINRLNQVKEKLVDLSDEVLNDITSVANDHNKFIDRLIEKYNRIQTKFGRIIEKTRGKFQSTKSNVNNSDEGVNLNEEDLCELIKESSDCTDFLAFCQKSEALIKNLEMLKEDILLKNYLITSHEYIRKNKCFLDKKEKSVDKQSSCDQTKTHTHINNSSGDNIVLVNNRNNPANSDQQFEKRKRKRNIPDLDALIEKTISESMQNFNKNKMMSSNFIRVKGSDNESKESTNGHEEFSLQDDLKYVKEKLIELEERNEKDDNKNEENFVENENEQENEHDSESLLEYEADGEKFTIRKGFPYKFYIKNLKITKYENLSQLEGKELSEESSESVLEPVDLHPCDTLEEITSSFSKYLLTIQSSLARGIGPLDEYILNNLDTLLHVKSIYFSEFNMESKPTSFNYEYFSQDENLTTSNFQNVKLVLCRKTKQPLHNLTKSCENFFSMYVKRKDQFGNCVFKGTLCLPFEKFQAYFLQKMKAFESVDTVQIEVYLFKWELFRDYNLELDRTNTQRDDLMKMKSLCEALDNARLLDRKRRLLEHE